MLPKFESLDLKHLYNHKIWASFADHCVTDWRTYLVKVLIAADHITGDQTQYFSKSINNENYMLLTIDFYMILYWPRVYKMTGLILI